MVQLGYAFQLAFAPFYGHAETGNKGACGDWLKNTGATIALGFAQYESGAHCGKQVTISFNGVTRTATVADACEACGYGDIDLVPALFTQFQTQDAGIFAATWYYTADGNGNPSPSSSVQPPPSSQAPPPPPPPPASSSSKVNPPPSSSTPPPQSSMAQSQSSGPSAPASSSSKVNDPVSSAHSPSVSSLSSSSTKISNSVSSESCSDPENQSDGSVVELHSTTTTLAENVTTSLFTSGGSSVMATLSKDPLGVIQTIGIGKIPIGGTKEHLPTNVTGIIGDVNQIVLQLGSLLVEAVEVINEDD
ncbi:hypothetical protein EMMF5_003479 [Cystobasidiomycetes sp. EMM_F5]